RSGRADRSLSSVVEHEVIPNTFRTRQNYRTEAHRRYCPPIKNGKPTPRTDDTSSPAPHPASKKEAGSLPPLPYHPEYFLPLFFPSGQAETSARYASRRSSVPANPPRIESNMFTNSSFSCSVALCGTPRIVIVVFPACSSHVIRLLTSSG